LRFKFTRLTVGIASAVVAIAVGGGAALAATGASAATPAPNRLCYNAGGSVIAAHDACPAKYKTFTGAVGPRGAAGAAGKNGTNGVNGKNGTNGTNGVNGTNGTSYEPVTASAQTDVTNDADSGNHGNWAVDTLTRQMTVTRHGAAPAADCGGTSTNGVTSCWLYTALMTDEGSFTTDSGAKSPNAGVTINGVLTGSITGGSSYEFYASSGTPNSALVPATLDATSGGTNSSNWPERFFPSTVAFGGMNEINWDYTYDAPATCETWTDAFNNSGGSSSAAGDITGVNACTS
jgi:hypothetical protein